MIQNLLFKIVTFPFSLIYGLIISIRNLFYRLGILKEISFNLPVISIGNLSMGGTGKSPHIEYMIQWLSPYLKVMVISRGYKRKSKGFLAVGLQHTADDVGDEPLQIKRKFPETGVFVAENRVLAIPKILSSVQEKIIILLDDAFQHRAIKPGLNILLTDYSNLFTRDFLLPSGRLREWRHSYKRADILLVTKCPEPMLHSEKLNIIREIKPYPYQKIFFTTYQYNSLYNFLFPELKIELQSNLYVLLICAIANSQFLLDYLKTRVDYIKMLEYEDHHDFSTYEVSGFKRIFNESEAENKIILTTEKDAVRLEKHRNYILENKLPIFVLPAYVSFLGDDELVFQNEVRNFLIDFKA